MMPIPIAQPHHSKPIPSLFTHTNIILHHFISNIALKHLSLILKTKTQSLHQTAQTNTSTHLKWHINLASNLTWPTKSLNLQSTIESYLFPWCFCYHKTIAWTNSPFDQKQSYTVLKASKWCTHIAHFNKNGPIIQKLHFTFKRPPISKPCYKHLNNPKTIPKHLSWSTKLNPKPS